LIISLAHSLRCVYGENSHKISIKYGVYFMLNLTRDINSLSNFKRETPKFIEQLRETKAPIVLTLNGVSELVVQSAEGYQELLDRLEELETEAAILTGLQEIKEGKGVSALPALAALRKKLKQELNQ